MMTKKQLKIILLCILFTAISTVSAANITSRSTHKNIEFDLLLKANSASTQSQSLNSSFQLSVQQFANGDAQAGENINWVIESDNIINRPTASFVIGSSLSVTSTIQITDSDGISTVTISAGEVPAIYRITATNSLILNQMDTSITLTQTFVINVGVGASIDKDTPENTIATTLDALCPKLEANISELNIQQTALFSQCSAVQQAIIQGREDEVRNALRQISPEEVAAQTDIGRNFNTQQLANITSRLNAVKHGTSKLSFNNLGFRYGGQRIPLSYLLNSLLSSDKNNDLETGALLNNETGIFVNGNISVGNRLATNKSDGFEFDGYSVTIGVDHRLSSTRFAGIALGLSKGNVLISDEGGELDATGYSLTIYHSQYFGKHWYIDSVVSLGSNTFDMQRNINFDLNGNTVNRIANSTTNGLQKGLSLNSGYEIRDGAFSATMFGSINYSNVNIDGFTETDAQELNLSISDQTNELQTSSLGTQLQFTYSTRYGVFIPFMSLRWIHEFKQSPNTITGSFASDDFNSTFDIKTEKPDLDYFSNVQGLTAVFPRGMSAFIRLENILARKFYSITNISFGGRMELQF